MNNNYPGSFSINTVEQMRKYYFPDSELTPDLLPQILAVLHEKTTQNHSKDKPQDGDIYNIKDCFIVHSTPDKEYTFSANDRFMYDETARDSYLTSIDRSRVDYFVGRPFAPSLDPQNGTIEVGGHKIKCSPFEYNFLVVLLRWSDAELAKGHLPINRKIDAPLVYIDQDICQNRGIHVDLDSMKSLYFSNVEHYCLDSFNRKRTSTVYTGDIVFSTHIKGKKVSLRGLRNPNAGRYVYKGVNFLLLDFSSGYKVETRKSHCTIHRGTRIYGRPEERTLYLSDTCDGYFGYFNCVFKLPSLSDYYSLAAWLVLALAYAGDGSISNEIEQYWPDYPHHQVNPHDASVDDSLAVPFTYRWTPNSYLVARSISRRRCFIIDVLEQTESKVNIVSVRNLKEDFLLECQKLLNGLMQDPLYVSSLERDILNEFLGHQVNVPVDRSKEQMLEPDENFFLSPSALLQKLSPVNVTIQMDSEKTMQLTTAIIDFFECLAIVFSLYNETFFKVSEKIRSYISLQRSIFDSVPITSGTGPSKSSYNSSPPAEPIAETTQQAGLPTPIDELENLIGLTSLKQDVKNLISFVKVQKLRKERGFTTTPTSLHMVFTGNPGTGKTTVARILAQIYKEIGVLSKGQLVEVDRSGLVAGYIGQTALKTQEKIDAAIGGILFVDEAYTLVKDGNDFGQEAIDTILKAMEDHRDELIVIVAGYDESMENFINSNPGLKSRFNKYFRFQNYSSTELIAIFRGLLNRYEYRITEEAMSLCEEEICAMESHKGEDFANGRDVRNYFEQIIGRQAVRVDALNSKSDEEIITIEISDVASKNKNKIC